MRPEKSMTTSGSKFGDESLAGLQQEQWMCFKEGHRGGMHERAARGYNKNDGDTTDQSHGCKSRGVKS